MGPGNNQGFPAGKVFARLWDIFLTNLSTANRSLCYVMAIQCFLFLSNLSLSVQLFTPVKQKLQWEERRYCCPYLFIYLFICFLLDENSASFAIIFNSWIIEGYLMSCCWRCNVHMCH